jgi:hypothetical protein
MNNHSRLKTNTQLCCIEKIDNPPVHRISIALALHGNPFPGRQTKDKSQFYDFIIILLGFTFLVAGLGFLFPRVDKSAKEKDDKQ